MQIRNLREGLNIGKNHWLLVWLSLCFVGMKKHLSLFVGRRREITVWINCQRRIDITECKRMVLLEKGEKYTSETKRKE